MSIKTLTVEQLDDIRPGDAIVAIDGHELGIGPRVVRKTFSDGWRTDSPYEHSTIEWRIYRDHIYETVTISPAATPKRRTFKRAEAAAKAWGNAHGIYNSGGSLYWDAETTEAARDLAKATGSGLGVRRVERRGFSRLVGDYVVHDVVFLVTGYSHDIGVDKGWETLSKRLLRQGILVRDGDRSAIA